MKSVLEIQLNQETQKQKVSLFKDLKTGEETLLSGGLYEAIASNVALSPQPSEPQGQPQNPIVAVGANGQAVRLSDLVKYLASMGLVPRG